VDTEAVRSFVLAADLGQVQRAADELGLTQQAVSKRIAGLERSLGVRLLTRTPRGVETTREGRAFLTHARDVLAGVDRALAAVRQQRRPLRIDVLGLRTAQAVILHEFWQANPATAVEVVTLRTADPREAIAAVRRGEVDASFRTATDPSLLGDDLRMLPAFDSPTELLTGPAHPLADRAQVTPEQLRGHRLWVPGIAPGSEWADFYAQLTAGLALTIDATGPHFGDEVLLDRLATDGSLATLIGARDRYLWPPAHDLRRIPVTAPAIAYPVSLIVPRTNPHPTLTAILAHFHELPAPRDPVWRPRWPAAPGPD
jgi:DNA-binding transcriptional LysR family regulator